MPRTLLAYGLLAVCWLSWGMSYPVMRLILNEFDVWTSRALVMVVAGFTLLGIAMARGKSLRVPREYWGDLVIAGTCNMAIFQIGMSYGVLLLSPGRTALLIYTMPIWTAILAALVLGERVGRRHVVSLALGLASIVILLSQDLSNLTNAPAGAAATLMAAVAFAIGTVWMKRRIWRVDLATIVGWQVLIGTPPIIILREILAPPLQWGSISLGAWLGVLAMALFSNVFAYLAWFRVVSLLPAIVSGIGTLAVPAVGLLSSALIVGESIGWREAVALACIGSALVVTMAMEPRRDRRG